MFAVAKSLRSRLGSFVKWVNKQFLRFRSDLIIEKRCIIDLKTRFEGGNRIGAESRIYKSYFGFGTYVGARASINSSKIGRFCSIGNELRIVAGKHPLATFVSTHPAFYSLQKQAGFTYANEQKFSEYEFADIEEKYWVDIGSDVWIGDNVLILAGCSIGVGAVVATGAVVTKNVEPYSIVGGIPARAIKSRFDAATVESLLKTQWWNKPIEWIKKKSEKMANVETFIKDFELES